MVVAQFWADAVNSGYRYNNNETHEQLFFIWSKGNLEVPGIVIGSIPAKEQFDLNSSGDGPGNFFVID